MDVFIHVKTLFMTMFFFIPRVHVWDYGSLFMGLVHLWGEFFYRKGRLISR